MRVRHKVEQDVDYLLKLLMWVGLVVAIAIFVAGLLGLARKNYEEAVGVCVKEGVYSESYCKFLAK